MNATLDEPDPLPALLPVLRGLHNLLYRCRFPAFWETYRSNELETLRDNYTVECVGFENAVRDVAVRAVKAAFTRISTDRLATYLSLSGASRFFALTVTFRDSYVFQALISRLTLQNWDGIWIQLRPWWAFLQTRTTRSKQLSSKKTSNYLVGPLQPVLANPLTHSTQSSLRSSHMLP